eukprot:scaffold1769_cov17-Prasinocladus_malaysianus.AAC.1
MAEGKVALQVLVRLFCRLAGGACMHALFEVLVLLRVRATSHIPLAQPETNRASTRSDGATMGYGYHTSSVVAAHRTLLVAVRRVRVRVATTCCTRKAYVLVLVRVRRSDVATRNSIPYVLVRRSR